MGSLNFRGKIGHDLNDFVIFFLIKRSLEE